MQIKSIFTALATLTSLISSAHADVSNEQIQCYETILSNIYGDQPDSFSSKSITTNNSTGERTQVILENGNEWDWGQITIQGSGRVTMIGTTNKTFDDFEDPERYNSIQERINGCDPAPLAPLTM